MWTAHDGGERVPSCFDRMFVGCVHAWCCTCVSALSFSFSFSFSFPVFACSLVLLMCNK